MNISSSKIKDSNLLLQFENEYIGVLSELFEKSVDSEIDINDYEGFESLMIKQIMVMDKLFNQFVELLNKQKTVDDASKLVISIAQLQEQCRISSETITYYRNRSYGDITEKTSRQGQVPSKRPVWKMSVGKKI